MAYKLTHPDSDLKLEAEAGQVAMYVSQGWETARGAKVPDEAPTPASDATSKE